MRGFGWTVYWLIAAGFVVLCVFSGVWMHQKKEETVYLKQEIEQAVQVAGLENKFIYIRGVRLGGAGAGGQGAAQVRVKSPKQFISLVPRGERIYSSVELLGTAWGVKKVYWAFIENRAGIVIFERFYHREDWGVKNYSEEHMTIQWSNGGAVAGVVIGSVIGSIIILLILAAIFDEFLPKNSYRRNRYY